MAPGDGVRKEAALSPSMGQALRCPVSISGVRLYHGLLEGAEPEGKAMRHDRTLLSELCSTHDQFWVFVLHGHSAYKSVMLWQNPGSEDITLECCFLSMHGDVRDWWPAASAAPTDRLSYNSSSNNSGVSHMCLENAMGGEVPGYINGERKN